MNAEQLATLGQRFSALRVQTSSDWPTFEVAADQYLDLLRVLHSEYGYAQLSDLCGVDYLSYGEAEWDTADVSAEGFSRGVENAGPGRFSWSERPRAAAKPARFAVVLHLLSFASRTRVRVRSYCADSEFPVMASAVEIYPSANWYEREAFDLYGILFEGHPDLRRLLTDYGFIGHPFRKDFPLVGNVEVRFDPQQGRVIYEPVSIEPRVLVPRTVRTDSRYSE